MAKIIIHKSMNGCLKIDGTVIDRKIKELDIDAGVYDIVPGTETDDNYNTINYDRGSKGSIIWGEHEKITLDDNMICHIYIKRKLSLVKIIPVLKIKYARG